MEATGSHEKQVLVLSIQKLQLKGITGRLEVYRANANVPNGNLLGEVDYSKLYKLKKCKYVIYTRKTDVYMYVCACSHVYELFNLLLDC